jgi:predicted nucleotidyltransferase
MPTSQAGASIAARFQPLVSALLEACVAVYAERLSAVALFGSVARGTPRPDSDIDILIVAHDLPDGRMPRMDEFRSVDERLRSVLTEARQTGISTEVSPVIKAPDELADTPLLLDMTDDAQILLDREGLLAAALVRLRGRLADLGARRVWRGNAWFWDLKPDYKPGDVFEL